MPVNQAERWIRLLLGAVVLLFTGIIYAWAILKTPFAGEFGWNTGQLSLSYTITIVAFCIGGFFAGQLTGKTSPRVRLLIAAVLLFTGFFVTSRLSGKSILPLYLAYGVLAGSGVGFAYTTVIGMTNAWFPDKRGLCSGVLLMSFGLTSLIIGKVADAMMANPSIGWRTTFMVLAIAEAFVLVAASFFVRAPQAGTVFPAARASIQASAAASASARAQDSAREYTTGEMVRRPSFWLIFTYLVLLAAVGSAAIALAADILRELKVTSPATIIGIISLFNGLGRLCSGALFDRLGIRKTQFITSGVAIAAPVTVMLAIQTGSLAIGLAGLSLCYFSYGFAPTTSSVFASDFYGMRNFSQNFSVMNLLLVPAPFAATVSGLLFTSTGSFLIPFAVLTACSLVGLVLNTMIRKA